MQQFQYPTPHYYHPTIPYTFINVNHFGIHDKMLRVYSGEVRGGAKRKLDISNALTPPEPKWTFWSDIMQTEKKPL